MNKLIAGNTSLRVRNVSKHAAITAIGVATLALFGMNANATSVAAAGPSQSVDFKDLDLSKQADAKRLYGRLRLAASEVCVNYPKSRGMAINTPHARCVEAAVTNAIASIAHPNLTALHVAKSDAKLAQRKTKAPSNT